MLETKAEGVKKLGKSPSASERVGKARIPRAAFSLRKRKFAVGLETRWNAEEDPQVLHGDDG